MAGSPQQQQYVQLGGAIGGNGGGSEGVFVAIVADVGYRIYKSWWLHAEVMAGESVNDPHGNKFDGTLLHIRTGGEWRHRIFFVGTDLGYARERANGTLTYSSFVAALRVGLDLRFGDVHLRPGFELFAGDKLPGEPTIGGKDYEGGDVSLAVAYAW